MRSTLTLKSARGFTLIEMVMGLLLISILSVLTITVITGNLNESRYAETIRRMKVLRKGLVGEVQFRNGLTRGSFGYNGDLGAIPTATATLAALTTNPGYPAWSTNATSRISYGWSAGYLDSGNSTESFTADAWGSPWVYNPTGSPPTITSLAADTAAGGTGYDKDIVMQLPDSSRLSTVHGIILSNGNPFTGAAQVEINYPNGLGVATTQLVSVAASDKGHFVFSNVPQGVRSATVYVPTKAAATKTIGPSIFVVDRPFYAINSRFFDVGTSVGPTNLQVPIEMFDLPVTSSLINLFTNFERSRTPLNTTDYDGTVTYSFEVIASSSSLLGTIITFVNGAGNGIGSILVPGGISGPTRYRLAFTPTVGADEYRIQMPLVVLNSVTVYSSRIIVSQVGASKTRVYVPLTSGSSAAATSVANAAIDTLTSTTYGQGSAIPYSLWLKNAAKLSLATGNPYTFSAVLYSGSIIGTASAALFNKTSGQPVAGASVSVAGVGATLASATFSDAATNFDDLSEFEVRIKSNLLFTAANLSKAGLWIKLDKLGNGEVYYRTSMNSTGTGTQTFDEQRQVMPLSSFSNPTVFSEVVGSTATAGTPMFTQVDAATADVGTTGSTLSGSGSLFTTTKSRIRSGAILPTSGNRYFGGVSNSPSSSTTVVNGHMIVQFHY